MCRGICPSRAACHGAHCRTVREFSGTIGNVCVPQDLEGERADTRGVREIPRLAVLSLSPFLCTDRQLNRRKCLLLTHVYNKRTNGNALNGLLARKKPFPVAEYAMPSLTTAAATRRRISNLVLDDLTQCNHWMPHRANTFLCSTETVNGAAHMRPAHSPPPLPSLPPPRPLPILPRPSHQSPRRCSPRAARVLQWLPTASRTASHDARRESRRQPRPHFFALLPTFAKSALICAATARNTRSQ